MKDPLVGYWPVCYPDMDAPGALNPPVCAPLGTTLRAALLPESRLPPLMPTGSGDLKDTWANQFCTIFLGLFFTQRRVHERSQPTSKTPGASRSREPGELIHAQSPDGKCGTSSVLSGVEDPCQVTSDQNQLLFALWSRSWFISDGDYISVGEHLS